MKASIRTHLFVSLIVSGAHVSCKSRRPLNASSDLHNARRPAGQYGESAIVYQDFKNGVSTIFYRRCKDNIDPPTTTCDLYPESGGASSLQERPAETYYLALRQNGASEDLISSLEGVLSDPDHHLDYPTSKRSPDWLTIIRPFGQKPTGRTPPPQRPDTDDTTSREAAWNSGQIEYRNIKTVCRGYATEVKRRSNDEEVTIVPNVQISINFSLNLGGQFEYIHPEADFREAMTNVEDMEVSVQYGNAPVERMVIRFDDEMKGSVYTMTEDGTNIGYPVLWIRSIRDWNRQLSFSNGKKIGLPVAYRWLGHRNTTPAIPLSSAGNKSSYGLHPAELWRTHSDTNRIRSEYFTCKLLSVTRR